MSNAMPPGPWIGAIRLDEGTLALTGSPTPGPSGLIAESGPLEAADLRAGELQPVEWKRLGFRLPPHSVIYQGGRLYRVWGGTSLERGDARSAGVFFSFERPVSQRHAERLFAIVEFGNACTFVSEFDVPPGTPMFVGAVDPGDDVQASLAEAGEQAFIRNPWAQRLVRVAPASRLANDLDGAWVYTGTKTQQPEKGARTGWQ